MTSIYILKTFRKEIRIDRYVFYSARNPESYKTFLKLSLSFFHAISNFVTTQQVCDEPLHSLAIKNFQTNKQTFDKVVWHHQGRHLTFL